MALVFFGSCTVRCVVVVCCGKYSPYVCSVSSRYGTILLICCFFVSFSLVLLFENDSAQIGISIER